jgi:fatty acid kinase
VPDGDTGTNMLLTLQSAVEDVRDSEAREVGKIAALAAHGSLMGARGNSGVILSQVFRGFAKHVQGKADLGPQELAQALEEAANAAYRAVIKPTEGTILTVAREAGKGARKAADEPDATIRSVAGAAARAARAAVERTPSQLAILREAGVVDAGGFGLQVILEGLVKAFEGSDVEVAAAELVASAPAQRSLELPEEGWGYCTEFLIEGKDLAVDAIREAIAEMGNSALVVGDEDLIRVHVHTNEPHKVLAYASQQGTLTRTKVDDMSQQHRVLLGGDEPPSQPEPQASEGAARVPTNGNRPNQVGLVAVVAGSGLMDIFKGLGVDVLVEGGQTMNPSTQDMLQAVDQLPYDEVILLPNNGNVIPAATQVPALTEKKVHLVPTRNVPQGIAALVAFNANRPGGDNAQAMERASGQIETIEVTHAVRDSSADGVKVKKGDVIALVNDQLKHAGKRYGEVVSRAVKEVGADGFELVTVYRGRDAGPEELKEVVEALERDFPKLSVEVQDGGQQHYPFILSVE